MTRTTHDSRLTTKTVSFSIILIGFTAMAAQIVLAREFLVVFYGNELTISFILAAWLLGGAAGSMLLGRFSDRIKNGRAVFALCLSLLSIILPLNILAIRSIKTALDINPGEIIGFFPVVISSLVILAPLCIILGFMFVLACSIYKKTKEETAGRISMVYVLEAVGSLIGGLIASFFLVRLMNSVYIMAMLSLLNLSASFPILGSSKRTVTRYVIIFVAGFLALAVLVMWPAGGWRALRDYSLKQQWKELELVDSGNSVYGNIAVTEKDDQVSFFDNGLHMYTVPDILRQEEIVHFAMLEHRDPQSVLLIGGGAGGLINEILKHPIRHVDYIEIDPLVVDMATRYLPAEYVKALKDRRVSVISTDGRLYVKTTDRKYDCVIINVGDPYTSQINRFYTEEFFGEASKIMNTGAVLSFPVTSSENYINRQLGNFLRSLYATLKKVFPEVRIIPGDTAFFLASDREGKLTTDYNILMTRARRRNLDLKYVCEYYLFSKLSPERIAYMENATKGRGEINYDFKPISYYYDMIFWASRFRDSTFAKLLENTSSRILWTAALCAYLIIIVGGFIVSGFKVWRKGAALLALSVTGFNGIALQVIILLSFQIIYGYMYYKLGVILTLFMAGLALGGLIGRRVTESRRGSGVLFIADQFAFGIYFLILPPVFYAFAASKVEVVLWFGSNILFLILPMLGGVMGGLQFSIANMIYATERTGAGRVAGMTYGIDLIGSCIGALLIGVFLIPILGVEKTCLIAALLNFVVPLWAVHFFKIHARLHS